jgi:hypothetical protein
MTFFNTIGLFLAGHLPPMYVILVLSAVLATGLIASVPENCGSTITKKGR